LRQLFHTASRRDLKTKEERRCAKNEYQKLRFKKVTDNERVGLDRAIVEELFYVCGKAAQNSEQKPSGSLLLRFIL
jgi:hypothetical protein